MYPSFDAACISTLKTIRIGSRDMKMSTVTSNELETTLEMDSHADTSCLGGGALIIYDYDQPVNVQGYDPTLGSKSYRTVSGAVLYDHPVTGARYH